MKKQVAFGFIKYSSGEWGPSFGAEVVSIIDIPFVEFEESYTALKQGFIESIKSKKITELASGGSSDLVTNYSKFFMSIVNGENLVLETKINMRFQAELEELFNNTKNGKLVY